VYSEGFSGDSFLRGRQKSYLSGYGNIVDIKMLQHSLVHFLRRIKPMTKD